MHLCPIMSSKMNMSQTKDQYLLLLVLLQDTCRHICSVTLYHLTEDEVGRTTERKPLCLLDAVLIYFQYFKLR